MAENIFPNVECGNPVLEFTTFRSRSEPNGNRQSATFAEICSIVEDGPIAERKDGLPLFKLATFAGDYRSDGTLESVHGIEGDYDAGHMQPAHAAALLQAVGIEAAIITTPSHCPDAPRWRVLCPLSAPVAPAARHELVSRLNGALGGILAPESWTAAQAFYFGSVQGGHPVQCWRVPGRPIDTLGGFQPVGPTQRERQGGRRFQPGDGRRAPSYEVALDALHSRDPADFDRTGWLTYGGAFFAASHDLADDEQRLADWLAWNAEYQGSDPDGDRTTWQDFERNGSDGDFNTLADMGEDGNAKGWRWFGGIEKQVPASVQQSPRTFFVRVGDMVTRPPEYLVSDLVETETMTLLFGDPAAGKSFVAIDLACCVATGRAFHGHAVKQGAVFYIAGEGRNGLKRRFDAWAQQNGIQLDDAALFTSDGVAAAFLDGNSASMVVNAIDALATTCGLPKMIVVDTLARNFGPGNENSQEDMGKFIAALDAMKAKYPGCVVMIVHHSGHAEKDRSRGSSVLKGALDVEFKVANKDGDITLENTKMKDGPTPAAMLFKLNSIGYSAALEYIGTPSRSGAKGLTQMQEKALEAFTSIGTEIVDIEEWRSAFYARHDGSDDARKRAFQRCRLDLARLALIEPADDDSQTFRRAPIPGIIER